MKMLLSTVNSCKFHPILRIWATVIIVQSNLRKIWATLDLLLVVIKGNLCHPYSVFSVFSENMGHPQPIKIVIVKKCPKLLRIYGRSISMQYLAGLRVKL